MVSTHGEPGWLAGIRCGSRWPLTFVTRSAPDKFSWGDYLPYPFFLGYAASYVQKHVDAVVHLRDSIAYRESYAAYYHALATERYDFVFIESASPSWDHDRELIRQIRKILPAAKIVIAGPIAAARGPEILATLPVYACIKGEYEKGSVRAIQGQAGIIDFDLLTVAEMNSAPFPYYDQSIAHRYVDVSPKGQIFPHAQVWSSRGCPFKCIFCVWPATMTGNDPDGSQPRAVRQYSEEYMEAFLAGLVRQYGFRSIYFDDDTFNLGNNHVVKMCRVMKRLGIPWSAMCRADTIKNETWGLMRESGCFGVKIGFESGSQHVIDHIINKHLDLERARQTVVEIKRLGMNVHGTFTYGLPGETRQQMLQTKQFIASLPLDSFQESGTAEIEGTPLATLREQGHLKHYDAAKIDDGYIRETDGVRKWRAVVDDLKNG